MIGAIAGNVIGSVHEFTLKKSAGFPLIDPRCRYTSDTVLTVATAWAILTDTPYGMAYHAFGRRYSDAEYDSRFLKWLHDPRPRPYNGRNNGSAMRVSPVGWAFHTRDDVLREAGRSAAFTHDHPEGIKGAQATALAVFLARGGASKEDIRDELREVSGYDLNRSIDEIRDGYQCDISCQGSVPEGIIAFLDSTDFEDAIRLAVSLGGDADTQAAIAGGIAHAFYRRVPASIAVAVRSRLPAEFIDIIDQFDDRFL
jgi:ADP-ribosylglycohydrolase